MEALLVLGAFIVIALAVLNIICFSLSLFGGGKNLVESRKKGNNL